MQWSIDTAYDLWQLSKPQQQVVQRHTTPIWQPPQEGWTKCNVDGAFYQDLGQGAVGAVLRDSTGMFGGGRAQWYCHGLDALTMEALACRDGMAFAREKGSAEAHFRN